MRKRKNERKRERERGTNDILDEIFLTYSCLGHFPLPYYACIIFATMDVLCCTSSIWHMSTMSMDRYFTIRFPFRYGRNKTRRIMLLKIIAVWAISTAISSPVFVLGIVNKENVLSDGICAANNASFKLYGSVFAFYIPFVIMIITYALTMRSLRNVLVNKKRYSRERTRKQTFLPLAHIVNQYAEIAHNIRGNSSIGGGVGETSTGGMTTTVLSPVPPSPSTPIMNSAANHSIFNKTPYAIITTSSANDVRTQLYPMSKSELNFKAEGNHFQYGSIPMSNGTSSTYDQQQKPQQFYYNPQHLTISYRKGGIKKRRRFSPQSNLNMNSIGNSNNNNSMTNTRTKTECDMSTVYEITEYSKSTSSSHDMTLLINPNHCRRSIVSSDQQNQSKTIVDQQENSSPTKTMISSNVNIISPLEEEGSSMTDIDSASLLKDFNQRMKIFLLFSRYE